MPDSVDEEVMAALLHLRMAASREMVLPITGWSMGCALGPACEVLVEPLQRTVRLGDVVVFMEEENFVAHRVVAVDRETLLTKGDNCLAADLPVRRSDIVGRVAGIMEEGSLRVPWHWRFPFSVVVALLSRWEAADHYLLSTLLRRLHRFWQARIMWRFMRIDPAQGG